MVEIQLPAEVKELVEGSIFDLDDNVDDNRLSKFLFYAPELVKIYGLSIAELKRQKRNIEKSIRRGEDELDIITSRILLDLDLSAYKNEALRNARMSTDPEVQVKRIAVRELKEKLMDIDSDIDEMYEYYWNFKSLRESLSDISKARTAERRS